MQKNIVKKAICKMVVTILPLFFMLSVLPEAAAQNLGGRVLEKAPPGTAAPKSQWLDENGETVNLSDLRGKVVLLNFWATWCGPCVIEMPELDALQKKYGSAGLEVVAVAHDEEGPAAIKPFFAKHDLKHLDIYHGGATTTRPFEVRTLPSTYLIDREGMLVGHVPGFARWLTPALEKHIQATLKKGYQAGDSQFRNRAVRGIGD